MGSRKCGGCLSGLLIPLALWSITVNILLYFPNGQTSYASSHKLTNYVWYFEGICFSGVMMLIVAAVLLVLENDNSYKCCQSENCSKKYRTLLSIIFSALGIAFSGYCLVISALGLVQGPYCRTLDGWKYAFEGTAGRFLTDSSLWIQCLEPAHVVEWNIILFSILIALSGLQVSVCFIRVVIQLSKIPCGTYSVIIQFSQTLLGPLINKILARRPHQFARHIQTVSIMFRFSMVPCTGRTMNRCQLNDSTTELETLSNNRGTAKCSPVYPSVN